MERVRKELERLLDVFYKENYGNRISQCLMIGLRSVIMTEIVKEIERQNPKKPKSPEKKPEPQPPKK